MDHAVCEQEQIAGIRKNLRAVEDLEFVLKPENQRPVGLADPLRHFGPAPAGDLLELALQEFAQLIDMGQENLDLVAQLFSWSTTALLFLALQRISDHAEAIYINAALQLLLGFEHQVKTAFGYPA
ncbi:hypothetical protein D3C73_699900 [compost metagenome]